MKHAASTYRQHAVEGASPLSLVVMLYDGAIAAISRAVTALESRDIEKKCAYLERALAIICQLEGSLDFEKGGEVAQTLKKFYTHARSAVLQANIQNSKESLACLLEQFSTVREAWARAERVVASSPPPAAKSGSPRERPLAEHVSSLRLSG